MIKKLKPTLRKERQKAKRKRNAQVPETRHRPPSLSNPQSSKYTGSSQLILIEESLVSGRNKTRDGSTAQNRRRFPNETKTPPSRCKKIQQQSISTVGNGL